MAFYTGKSKDGSDMREVRGMYISQNGSQWSSEPYPINNTLDLHLHQNNLSLKQEYQLILSKTSKASAAIRKYILDNYNALNPQNI